ncbi:MAG: hypothetical protein DMF07_14965 [Verrucomicrobia bacterium]|nr:MAG: hypothetical protein DMF07_14965 [Verrucomicrobiota bacterium]
MLDSGQENFLHLGSDSNCLHATSNGILRQEIRVCRLRDCCSLRADYYRTKFLGKEAAGVAAVALTALATAIFKQFETLRFKTIAEHEERTVSIPRLNIPYLLLLVFAFNGIQVLVGMLSGVIAGSFGWFKDVTSFDYRFLVLIGGVAAVSCFAGGYLCGRTAPRVSFSYASIGSILSLVVAMILQVIAVGWRAALSAKPVYTVPIFWGVYAACAFLGARIGFRGRMLFPESHSESV